MYVCIVCTYIQLHMYMAPPYFFFFFGVSFYLTERTALLPKKKKVQKLLIFFFCHFDYFFLIVLKLFEIFVLLCCTCIVHITCIRMYLAASLNCSAAEKSLTLLQTDIGVLDLAISVQN